jgi:hypothetical protein
MPSWLEMDSGLSARRDMLESRWSSVVRLPSWALDTSPVGRSSSPVIALDHLSALIDVTPPTLAADNPAAYVRSQFALATSSDTLRSVLRFVGINARHCVVPFMRMHSTLPGGDARARASILAKCSTD